jgi:hypothetical protein
MELFRNSGHPVCFFFTYFYNFSMYFLTSFVKHNLTDSSKHTYFFLILLTKKSMCLYQSMYLNVSLRKYQEI